MTFRRFFAFAALLVSPIFAADTDTTSTGFTVHEWGTFTSIAGPDGSAVEWLPVNGASDLPCFVEHLKTPAFKLGLTGTVRMETPVIYFYTDRQLDVTTRVEFPHGLITEWYPRATPSAPSEINDWTLRYSATAGRLEWASVRLLPQTTATQQLPRETAPSHYYAARATSAATVEIPGNPIQQERFLFYRGVANFQPPINAQVSNGRIELTVPSGQQIDGIILFENRGGKIGYSVRDSVTGHITIDRPNLGAGLGQLGKDLEAMLVHNGLFADEAHAMVETWRDSWFEEGARVFYVYPRQQLDSTLPLTILPAPANIERVFVGRMEMITPEMEQAVLTAAMHHVRSTLTRYGRFLRPIVQKLAEDHLASADDLSFANDLAFRMLSAPSGCQTRSHE